MTTPRPVRLAHFIIANPKVSIFTFENEAEGRALCDDLAMATLGCADVYLVGGTDSQAVLDAVEIAEAIEKAEAEVLVYHVVPQEIMDRASSLLSARAVGRWARIQDL